MLSKEIITEWKNVPVDPSLSVVRKSVSREINKLLNQFNLRRKWSNWENNVLGLQFWDRQPGHNPMVLHKDQATIYRKLARKIRQIEGVSKAQVDVNLHNTADIIITLQ